MSGERDDVPAPRAYDARSRRERAERERRETRARVLAAARRLFLDRGYARTTMVGIAAETGVALASVYRAGRSKAELVEALIVEEATLDPRGRRVHPEFPQLADQGDPVRQVQLLAELVAGVVEKVAPLFSVLVEAAAVDERAREALAAELDHRAASFRAVVAMLPAARLRGSTDEAADTLWVLCDPRTYLMLCAERGWSAAKYRDWLRRTLVLQLLGEAPEA